MRAILLFLFCVVSSAAHADCTPANDLVGTKSRVDWVEGGLVYDLTNDVLKTCDGTNWNTVAAGSGLSGGTSGYLGVWTGATTLALSSTTPGQNLFWDSTNHRLGIGTTTPGAKLDVNGNILMSAASPTITLNSGGPTISVPAANTLTFSTSGLERVRIDNSGNVGIGTTTPTLAGLQVDKLAGNTAAMFGTGAQGLSMVVNWPGIYFNAYYNSGAKFMGTGYAGQYNFDPGTGDTMIASSSASGTGGNALTYNTLVHIKNNGNVGIGTATPQSRLQVAGGIQLGDDSGVCPGASNIKLGTLRYNGGALQFCLAGGWSTLGAGGSNADTLDGFSSEDFLRSGQLYGGDNVLSIYGTNVTEDVWSGGLELREVNAVNNAQTASSYAPALTFHWGNLVASAIKMYSDGSFRFRDQSTNSTGYRPIYAGSMVSSGNVSATGNVVASGAFVHASADPYFVVDNNNKHLVLSGGSGWVNTGAAVVLRGAGTGTNTHGLEMYAGNAERLRILSNGNIGIGTAAPAAKLSIAINGAPSDPGNYGNAIQITNVATGGQQLAFIRAGNKVRSFGYLPNSNVFGLGNGTVTDASFTPSVLSVSNTDMVGIGTAAPSYTLDVQGTAYAAGAAGALSDARHKKNITTLVDGALDKVLRLRPVSFEWKAPKDDGMRGQQFGFIAQEIEKVFPPLVLTQDNEEKTKGIKPTELIPVLTKAMQELKADNDNLRTELDELRSDIEALKSAR